MGLSNLAKNGLTAKGQYLLKKNCHAKTSPKKRKNEFVFLS